MRNLALIAVTTTMLTFGGAGFAYADCTGNATAAGAVGGGLIAGLATHNVAAGLGGAVVGGLIGNSVARGSDCDDHEAARANDRAYAQGYDDRASEERGPAPPPPDSYQDRGPDPYPDR
jgi:hypothetical protein